MSSTFFMPGLVSVVFNYLPSQQIYVAMFVSLLYSRVLRLLPSSKSSPAKILSIEEDMYCKKKKKK